MAFLTLNEGILKSPTNTTRQIIDFTETASKNNSVSFADTEGGLYQTKKDITE